MRQQKPEDEVRQALTNLPKRTADGKSTPYDDESLFDEQVTDKSRDQSGDIRESG